MREAQGDLWDFYNQGNWVCITTNGTIKKNGEAVMGAGCAKEATQRFPGIQAKLGVSLSINTNRVVAFNRDRLIMFPVKHNWYEKADLDLIEQSARQLIQVLDKYPEIPTPVYLPRPGTGNGKLDWGEVKTVISPILDDRVVVVTW